MQSIRLKQYLLIVVIGGLIAFIFFKGKNDPEVLIEKDRNLSEENIRRKDIDFRSYISRARSSLHDSLVTKVSRLNSLLERKGRDSVGLKQIAVTWDRARYPGIAGYYFEKIAARHKTAWNWHRAAGKYYEAQKVASDSTYFNYFVEKSIHCFNKVLELSPNNLNAKSDLAVTYIEGKGKVMKGVGLLKEVEQVSPDNKKALFYLGVLSMRSKQFEKAYRRFERLAQLQPENPFNHFYFGQACMAMGKNDEALEAFKKYRNLVKEKRLKEEAGKLIDRLENR